MKPLGYFWHVTQHAWNQVPRLFDATKNGTDDDRKYADSVWKQGVAQNLRYGKQTEEFGVLQAVFGIGCVFQRSRSSKDRGVKRSTDREIECHMSNSKCNNFYLFSWGLKILFLKNFACGALKLLQNVNHFDVRMTPNFRNSLKKRFNFWLNTTDNYPTFFHKILEGFHQP